VHSLNVYMKLTYMVSHCWWERVNHSRNTGL